MYSGYELNNYTIYGVIFELVYTPVIENVHKLVIKREAYSFTDQIRSF